MRIEFNACSGPGDCGDGGAWNGVGGGWAAATVDRDSGQRQYEQGCDLGADGGGLQRGGLRSAFGDEQRVGGGGDLYRACDRA
jgi:hypothetical protein